ncbi:class I SAM-dependent methyltransferase [Sphingomonas sp. LY54]|uniref:class I SAM-dependent methyltransferase n=1 Tax=Sphingomonas sp. LY54 TaxID=3095343 RepID=UPI002D787EF8|nr:class I SAM-dependent methyltransferase [Sphingomonas sp. LY54]WRP27586.1 class I SAM-dependent methyltransferase [Sphingomonas sp. LY54]
MNIQMRAIGALNPLFQATNWVDVLESGDQQKILAATQKSGEVVLGQFYGYNDLRGKVVLDFGCGSAGKTLYYAKQGASETYGVDVSIDYAGTAIEQARDLGLKFHISQITPDNGIPLPDASIDLVLSSSVLEHLSNLDRSLAEVRRVLKPGGLFLNRWHPYQTRFGSHLNSIIGIPFAHRIFSEKALMAFYYDNMVSRHGHVPAAVASICRDGQLNDIMYMNRIKPQEAHRAFRRAGLEMKALRYFRGMKEQTWVRNMPEPIKLFGADYEVNVLQKV